MVKVVMAKPGPNGNDNTAVDANKNSQVGLMRMTGKVLRICQQKNSANLRVT
jgi:hypothetical protein